MNLDNASSEGMSFSKGIFFTSLGSISNIVVLFAETALAVRLLTQGDYGVYVLLVAIANFLVMAVDFGCKIAVTQQIATAERDKQAVIVNSVFVFRIVTLILTGLLIWLGQNLLGRFDKSGTILLYAMWLPIMFTATSLDQLGDAMLKGFKLYQHVAVAQVLRSILRFALTAILLLVFEMGILGVVLSWIGSFLISALFQYWMLPVRKRLSVDWAVLMQVLRFGAPLQITNFLWRVSEYVQVLVLSLLAGPSVVALFDVAAKIPLALQRFSDSFVSVYFPTMAGLLSNKQMNRASWMLNQSLKLSSFAIGVGVLIAVLFSSEIVGTLFSAKYLEASFTFGILMLAFHMSFLVNLLGYTLTSAGYPQRTLIENTVRAIASVVGALALIPFFSFNGAAGSRLIANYLANPIVVWLLRKSDINVEFLSYVRQTGLLWVASLIGLGVLSLDLSLVNSWLIRIGILLLFVVANLVIGTISIAEINNLIPQSVRARFGLQPVEVADIV